MKFRILRFVLVMLSAIVLVTCSVLDTKSEEELAEIRTEAKSKTGRGIDLAVSAALYGDRTGLDEFIAAEDVDGELGGIFDEYFAMLETDGSKDVPAELIGMIPPELMGELLVWYNGEVVNKPLLGDVLLFASSGSSWQNILMSAVLIRPYFSHAGIVDPNKFPGDECVLSATIDITDAEIVNGVTIQSLNDLKADSVLIIRLPYEIISEAWKRPDSATYVSFYADYNDATTDYAFVTPDMRLDPITKEDGDYFYCSKVPWFVYDMNPGMDIEQDVLVDYYETRDGETDTYDFAPGARWMDQRESLLYKLYKFFLWVDGTPWWRIQREADKHVMDVLRELVSPDELLGYFAAGAGIVIP